ncbi:MAG TPA: glycosyltransferase family 2 protein [Myxococcota bacterium]|nr:glycosyltransferase family 2 protein [Myxococcota bacterium]
MTRQSFDLLSIVVPVYNEEDGIEEFHRRLLAVVHGLRVRAEIIYVDDGSADRTLELLGALADASDNVAIVTLSRNFGKEIAMTAGLDHAAGDAVAIIDADLQDPPEVLPDLLRTLEGTGADLVYGKRTSRKGETALKKMTAHLFYRVMNRLSDLELPTDSGDFRILNRRAVDALRQLREHHRFMKGLFSWIGFRQIAFPYERDGRFAGHSKFNYWRLWNFSLEGITSFTIAPLKLASYVGLLTAIGAGLYGLGMIVGTLVWGNPVAGYPSLLVVMLFLGGLQLMTLGMLGEYLGRVYNETKHRPLYFVQEFRPSGAGRRSAHLPASSLPKRPSQRAESASGEG